MKETLIKADAAGIVYIIFKCYGSTIDLKAEEGAKSKELGTGSFWKLKTSKKWNLYNPNHYKNQSCGHLLKI